MDRIRSALNGVIKNERYSRFTLQPAEDGERHVEVKLSDDGVEMEEEEQAGGSPSFRPAPPQLQNRRHLCFMITGIAVIFISGVLIGYLSHPEPKMATASCSPPPAATNQTKVIKVTTAPPAAPAEHDAQMDWANVADLLTKKLSSEAFDKTLKEFNLQRRSAGSQEDQNQANQIYNEFKKLQMDPWIDEHYVQLQKADSSHPNRVIFGANNFTLTGFLAYSAARRVQGKLVYGNYGRQKDLEHVQKKSVELKGSVLLLRAGNISFAEQVDNAAKMGASGVLIYPDKQDFKYEATTTLFGHVHLGSGDPYTPGFPSFNHTQFPPTRSSGLPEIPAQTITAKQAELLMREIGGPEADAVSGFKGGMSSQKYSLGGVTDATVEVNNVLVNTEIHNVLGVIKGFDDPDRYVVLGAQRDAWGRGYARAAVGTSVLIELARAIQEMVEKDGFRPRRSLVFASWGAGEYGNVGATEWLEGYMASINRRVVSYINLDGVVMGRGSFIASASPLLYGVLESTMKEVSSPLDSGSVYDLVGRAAWRTMALRPMSRSDSTYPFTASSGIPSVSFHFISLKTETYMYYGTNLDHADHLNSQTNQRTGDITALAAQFAGRMALRLVHDHLVRLSVSHYSQALLQAVARVNNNIVKLKKAGQLTDVSSNWLSRARGSFFRAAEGIRNDIINTDLTDKEACRVLNDRMMAVEHCLLSPYVSPIDTPFRHILLGQGAHTLSAIAETADPAQLHTQLALTTWTLQGCANAMAGNIWDIDNLI